MNDAFFFIPESVTLEKHPKGSAPTIVDDLCTLITDSKEIWISMFLFNLPFFQKILEDLATKNNAKIKIYTIPLEGYDNKSISLTYKEKGMIKKKITNKREYAQVVHERVRNHKNMELFYLYHTNLWSSQVTSRGRDSYSLHNKSIMFKRIDDSYMCASMSANLAIGDPLHSENLFVTSDSETVRVFKEYFSQLENHSIAASQYNEQNLQTDFKIIDACHIIRVTNETNCLFTAPFLKYQYLNQDPVGSNNFVYQKIRSKIESAQFRILICAQHFNDYEPYDSRNEGLGEAVLKMAKDNDELKVEILKQTLATHQKQGERAKKFENKCNSYPNIDLKYWHPIIHDKFIIVDNEVIVMTANITPTQFAWSEGHRMRVQNENGSNMYRNNFSDINSFHFTEDYDVLKKYEHHFENLSAKSTKLI